MTLQQVFGFAFLQRNNFGAAIKADTGLLLTTHLVLASGVVVPEYGVMAPK